MVKVLLTFLLLFTALTAENIEEVNTSVLVEDDLLTQKVKGFISEKTYSQNSAFIKIIFEPRSSYYTNKRVDVVKVVQTLKENGLLDLFFKKPQELHLHFKTSGSPLFFVKLMDDSLRNIGYYRYVTTASTLSSSEFTWSINLTSEYATDPLVLQEELHKVGCNIIDIHRASSTEWTYEVDMARGFLNIEKLHSDKTVKLKRSLYAHWLNVANIKKLRITSSRRNNWYPYIAYYDASLHLLKVIKKDAKRNDITLNIPKNAKYIKISDLYTLKNVKDALLLYPSVAR